jgi:hypothetical protein
MSLNFVVVFKVCRDQMNADLGTGGDLKQDDGIVDGDASDDGSDKDLHVMVALEIQSVDFYFLGVTLLLSLLLILIVRDFVSFFVGE